MEDTMIPKCSAKKAQRMTASSILVLFPLLLSCHSAQIRDSTIESPLFSDPYFDPKTWNRKTDCCSATGKRLAIASGGKLSSKAGLEMFSTENSRNKSVSRSASGVKGNIVDAVVAVSFCLAVERPQSLGIGGGGFMTLHLEKEKKDIFIDFRETAPRRASADMFLDKSGQVIAGASLEGALSVATPGFVAGLYDIHRKWGNLKWDQVLSPAIRLAEEGFPAYPVLINRIRKRKDVLKRDSTLTHIFLPDGENPPAAGAPIIQKDLAKTLRRIARGGKKIFYEGSIAIRIAGFLRQQKGILDETDLRDYKVVYREPIRTTFKTHAILSAPPPSAGGLVLSQTLGMLSGLDLNEMAKKFPSQYLHVLAEAMSRSYADRSYYVGDPDDPSFDRETFAALMAGEYVGAIGGSLNLQSHTPSDKIVPIGFLKRESPETSHVSIIDDEGNAAAATLSINYLFGSGQVVPGTGIILNDTMDDFSVKTGEKNVYGLIAGENNKIRPDRRPVSSMSPTIVLENDKPILVLGAAGGPRIISSVLQVTLNDLVLYGRQSLRRSVFAPRIHHQWVPDTLVMETGIPQSLVDEMKNKGHSVKLEPETAVLHAVHFNAHTKEFEAVFDPRDEGGAEAR